MFVGVFACLFVCLFCFGSVVDRVDYPMRLSQLSRLILYIILILNLNYDSQQSTILIETSHEHFVERRQ